jgi:hypothetical protein
MISYKKLKNKINIQSLCFLIVIFFVVFYQPQLAMAAQRQLNSLIKEGSQTIFREPIKKKSMVEKKITTFSLGKLNKTFNKIKNQPFPYEIYQGNIIKKRNFFSKLNIRKIHFENLLLATKITTSLQCIYFLAYKIKHLIKYQNLKVQVLEQQKKEEKSIANKKIFILQMREITTFIFLFSVITSLLRYIMELSFILYNQF